MAGFVNFSNRISSLLCVTLALTSSSRIDKYAPWMLSWQSEPLTDRDGWVPRFPCPFPLNLCLDQCGKWLSDRRMLILLWRQCQLPGVVANYPHDTERSEGRWLYIGSALSKARHLSCQTHIGCPLENDALFSGICHWIIPVFSPHLLPWLFSQQANERSPLGKIK